jgi:hypothetical protein
VELLISNIPLLAAIWIQLNIFKKVIKVDKNLKEKKKELDKQSTEVMAQFALFRRDCEHYSIESYDTGDWFKCNNPDHTYYNTRSSICRINECPLLKG